MTFHSNPSPLVSGERVARLAEPGEGLKHTATPRPTAAASEPGTTSGTGEHRRRARLQEIYYFATTGFIGM